MVTNVTMKMIMMTTKLINLGKKGKKIIKLLIIDLPMTTTMTVTITILYHDNRAKNTEANFDYYAKIILPQRRLAK